MRNNLVPVLKSKAQTHIYNAIENDKKKTTTTNAVPQCKLHNDQNIASNYISCHLFRSTKIYIDPVGQVKERKKLISIWNILYIGRNYTVYCRTKTYYTPHQYMLTHQF